MIKIALLHTLLLLNSNFEDNHVPTTYENHSENYTYISISKVNLTTLKNSFMTSLDGIDTIYFIYAMKDKEDYFYVLEEPDQKTTDMLLIRNSQSYFVRLNNGIEILKPRNILPEDIEMLFFVSPNLKVEFCKKIIEGESPYALKVNKRNEEEYEVFIGIEYPKNSLLFKFNKEDFLTLSIFLPHINPSYTPYLWLFREEEMPNLLLYEYRQDKIGALYNVFK